jgi:hypothetical protein
LLTIISNDPTDALRKRVMEARERYDESLDLLASKVIKGEITPQEGRVELRVLSERRRLEILELYGLSEDKEDGEHSGD